MCSERVLLVVDARRSCKLSDVPTDETRVQTPIPTHKTVMHHTFPVEAAAVADYPSRPQRGSPTNSRRCRSDALTPQPPITVAACSPAHTRMHRRNRGQWGRGTRVSCGVQAAALAPHLTVCPQNTINQTWNSPRIAEIRRTTFRRPPWPLRRRRMRQSWRPRPRLLLPLQLSLPLRPTSQGPRRASCARGACGTLGRGRHRRA